MKYCHKLFFLFVGGIVSFLSSFFALLLNASLFYAFLISFVFSGTMVFCTVYFSCEMKLFFFSVSFSFFFFKHRFWRLSKDEVVCGCVNVKR